MERKEDIPVLLKYFIDKFSDEYNTIKPEIPDDVLTSLINYEWPGNVRQLKNFIQRILLNGFEKITQKVLNEYLHIEDIPICEVGEMDFTCNKIIPLKDFEREMRKKYFMYVREQTKSDTEAAKMLGLAPSNFYRMCKELGLK